MIAGAYVQDVNVAAEPITSAEARELADGVAMRVDDQEPVPATNVVTADML